MVSPLWRLAPLILLVPVTGRTDTAAAAGEIRRTCGNEVRAFCPGSSDGHLKDCLLGFKRGLMSPCRILLLGTAAAVPAGPPEGSWTDALPASPPQAGAVPEPCTEGPDQNSVPGLAVSIRCEYYSVHGVSTQDVLNSIRLQGPSGGHWGIVNRAMATAGWRYSWKWRYDRQPSGCRLSEPALQLVLTYRYPKWNVTPYTEPETLEWWKRTLQTVRVHEEGHGRISTETLQEALNALRALPGQPSCEAVDSAAESAVRTAIEKGMRRQAAHDGK